MRQGMSHMKIGIAGILCILCLIAGGRSSYATGGYQAPPMATSEFHESAAEGDGQVHLDLSDTANGVIAVKVVADNRCKFQSLIGDQTYTYDVPSDGTPVVFPIQCGSGHYTFRVLENVTGTKYAMLYLTEADVTLTDEFQPFLRPSAYVNYSADSLCVKKAAELAIGATNAMGVVKAIYGFICKTVVYDKEFAQTVATGYLPTPDVTMTTGKGICVDYAALAAAMLRSQGIPAKVVYGYVSPDDLYHAWNMFYTKETGWVTVDYQVSKDTWNRLDLTFSANGADGQFIGDGSNYADVFYY